MDQVFSFKKTFKKVLEKWKKSTGKVREFFSLQKSGNHVEVITGETDTFGHPFAALDCILRLQHFISG